MPSAHGALLICTLLLTGCGANATLRMTGSDWRAYVQQRGGGAPGSELASLQFKPGLCEGENLRQEVATLNESHLLAFLAKQGIDVRLDRQREDLIYAHVTGAGAVGTVSLRVAILKSADAAGRELHEAMLQHGEGSWGVHRGNLAVLGPVGQVSDDLTFAAKTKLACWGVVTVAGVDDTFVVPGGYFEL